MAKIVQLTNGSSAAAFCSLGAQILSWTVGGKQLLFQGTLQRRQGIPILFPFADKLEQDIYQPSGSKLTPHGFGRDLEWSIVAAGDNWIKCQLSEASLNPHLQLAYPYQFVASIEYRLLDKRLIVSLTVSNLSDLEMRIAPGLHPYFPVVHGQKNQLELVDVNGENILPDVNWDKEMSSGKLMNWDGGKVKLMLKDWAVSIQESTQGAKQFQNLVVWSQTPDYPDYDFVCIEQFSRPANGINTDPIIVKPKQIWETTIEFALENHQTN